MNRAERILVIDDDPAHLEIVGTLLEHHGYGLVLESTPASGFATALEVRPDAIITGLHFDGAPAGLGLIDRLRAQPITASIPIVVVSSFTDVHAGALRERGVRCIEKGGPLTRIIEELERLLASG